SKVSLSRNAFSSAANARSHTQVQTPSARLRNPDVLPTYHLFPQTYRDPQLDNPLLFVTVAATPCQFGTARPARSPSLTASSWAHVNPRGACFMPRRMFSTVPFPSGASSRSIWEKLYERAILELDYAKVPERIAEARQAMHDRAEEVLTESSSNERGALSKALRNLGLLEEVTAREKSMEFRQA